MAKWEQLAQSLRFWLTKILFFLGSEVLIDKQRVTEHAGYLHLNVFLK